MPPPPTNDEKLDSVYSIIREMPEKRSEAEALARDRHKLLVEKFAHLEGKVDTLDSKVDQRFRGLEARVTYVEQAIAGKSGQNTTAATAALVRSMSPPEGTIKPGTGKASDTGSHYTFDLEKQLDQAIKRHETEEDADAFRAIKGGSWKVALVVAGALAVIFCSLLGGALIQQAVSRGGNQTNIVTPAAHP